MEHTAVSAVPRIQQQPDVAHKDAIHYGYCAYKDISLASSNGLDHKVQPPHSPYYRTIPCRSLIPFVSFQINEIDDAAAGVEAFEHKVLPLVWKPKSARESIDEMVYSYGGWGFVTLTPMTGMDEADAELIFNTIQPFKYKLKDLQNEIDFGAVERIANTEPYTVVYNDATVDLQPLPERLKEKAEEVRNIIAGSVAIAVEEASQIGENTKLSMTSAFSGGAGKRQADPHDRYVFAELGQDIPQLITTNSQPANVTTTVATDPADLELRRMELEIRQQELQLKRIELGLDPKPVVEAVAEVIETPEKPKRGDKVDIDGIEATVVDTRFGKVKAELPSGEVVQL